MLNAVSGDAHSHDMPTAGEVTRPTARRATRPQSPLLALQASAGNAAVSEALALQRHAGPTTATDLGLSQGLGGAGGGGARKGGPPGAAPPGAPGSAPGGGATPASATPGATPAPGAAVNPAGGGTATTAPPARDYRALASRMKAALDGVGTDEDEVYAVLRTVGAADMDLLRDAYQDLTRSNMDADIAADMSGTELALARALAGQTREQRIRAELGKIAWGSWALGVVATRGISVVWDFAGTGSYHSGGTIYLNRRTPAPEAALVMVHEAQHAETYITGRGANATALGRAEFITRMIADEAEASTRQLEAAVGVTDAGVTAGSVGQSATMVQQFRTQWAAVGARLRAEGVTGDEVNRRAHAELRDGLVLGWFNDGTYRTSTSGAAAITYAQHYGNEWDRLNNVAPASGGGGGGGGSTGGGGAGGGG